MVGGSINLFLQHFPCVIRLYVIYVLTHYKCLRVSWIHFSFVYPLFLSAEVMFFLYVSLNNKCSDTEWSHNIWYLMRESGSAAGKQRWAGKQSSDWRRACSAHSQLASLVAPVAVQWVFISKATIMTIFSARDNHHHLSPIQLTLHQWYIFFT